MPDYVHGKICYLELATRNLEESQAFYQQVFGWKHRTRRDGSTAFDDTTGEVSGTWTPDRAPQDDGMLLHHGARYYGGVQRHCGARRYHCGARRRCARRDLGDIS